MAVAHKGSIAMGLILIPIGMYKKVHEALRQRITVHYNYEGISDQEVPDYICHKLELAGGSRSIMEGGALSAIHGYSEGNTRKNDNLMTDALTIGS